MKALYCHVTVKDYLTNNLWKFLIKIVSTWRREIKEPADFIVTPADFIVPW